MREEPPDISLLRIQISPRVQRPAFQRVCLQTSRVPSASTDPVPILGIARHPQNQLILHQGQVDSGRVMTQFIVTHFKGGIGAEGG